MVAPGATFCVRKWLMVVVLKSGMIRYAVQNHRISGVFVAETGEESQERTDAALPDTTAGRNLKQPDKQKLARWLCSQISEHKWDCGN